MASTYNHLSSSLSLFLPPSFLLPLGIYPSKDGVEKEDVKDDTHDPCLYVSSTDGSTL